MGRDNLAENISYKEWFYRESAKEYGSIGGKRNGARQKAKTHCPRGHEYNEENTYVNPPNGSRNCRICKRGGKGVEPIQSN